MSRSNEYGSSPIPLSGHSFTFSFCVRPYAYLLLTFSPCVLLRIFYVLSLRRLPHLSFHHQQILRLPRSVYRCLAWAFVSLPCCIILLASSRNPRDLSNALDVSSILLKVVPYSRTTVASSCLASVTAMTSSSASATSASITSACRSSATAIRSSALIAR